MAQNNIVMDGYTLPTGVMTRNDVKGMQQALGVKSDGIWGPKTQTAYDSYVQQRGEEATYAYPNLRPPAGITTNGGVAALQSKLGVYSTGLWDQSSQDALDQTLIRQLPYNNGNLANVQNLTPAQEYDLDMLGYEYGIGRGNTDYAMAGYTPPEWLDSKDKVTQYQGLLGVTADGLWGPRTDAAHQAFVSAVNESAYQGAPYNAAQWGTTLPRDGTVTNEVHAWATNEPKPVSAPGYGVGNANVDTKPYWNLIYDNKSTYIDGDVDIMDSMLYQVEEYFADTIDFSSVKSRAESLYSKAVADYKAGSSALDISVERNDSADDVIKKLWDRPLDEIIARCLINEFGYARNAKERVNACHAIINRMFQNETDFKRGTFVDGELKEPKSGYPERQLKELLFGPGQYTTIDFRGSYKEELEAGKTTSLANYVAGRTAYTLSKYVNTEAGKKAWKDACYLGTILAAMFEELPTTPQIYDKFGTYVYGDWKSMARSYHMVFDGILQSVYNYNGFSKYDYDGEYKAGWNSKDFR